MKDIVRENREVFSESGYDYNEEVDIFKEGWADTIFKEMIVD